MPYASACPEPMLSAGETSAGFTVRRVVPLPEIRITAYELEHGATGAQVLHLHCADRENLFAVAFRTPPHDSTGLPHILEHSVLAGSERYPSRTPSMNSSGAACRPSSMRSPIPTRPFTPSPARSRRTSTTWPGYMPIWSSGPASFPRPSARKAITSHGRPPPPAVGSWTSQESFTMR